MPQPHFPISRRLAALGQGCALALLVLAAGVHADDTEIFFGQSGSIDRPDNRPNVLFVLDTSGSMNWYRDGTTTPSGPGDSTRIDRLKTAMHRILDELDGVNVGLARFNGAYGGGAIIAPITPIDEIVCHDALCDEVSTFSQVSGAAGDAEEHLSNGKVSLDDFTLNLGAQGGGGGAAKLIGLSFADLDVPQGARIVSARIEFTADKSGSRPTSLTLAAENALDAAPFSDTDHDISERPTNAPVAWTPGSWSNNSVYDSPELGALVQGVTDQPGWCGRNTLNVLIRGTGSRSAASVRRDPAKAPKLKVTYDASDIPPGGGCTVVDTESSIASVEDNVSQRFPDDGTVYTEPAELSIPRHRDDASYPMLTGLRFDTLAVPKDASIEEAYVILTAGPGSDTETARVSIEVQDSDDAPPYASAPWAVSSLPRLAGSVSWDLPSVVENQSVRSPDIASLLEDAVTRPGWRAGNAVSLLLRPDAATPGQRYFQAYGSGTPASLHIRYRVRLGGRGSDRSARGALKEAVSNLEPYGGTPIVGALYEASQYLTGGAVDFGRTRGYKGDLHYDHDGRKLSILPQPSGDWSNVGEYDYRGRLHRTSHPDTWSGGTLESDCPLHDPNHPDCRTETIDGAPVYTSPIVSSCQSNHVILLSDGQPSGNGAAKRVEALTGESCFGVGAIDEQCGVELTGWLNDTDHDSASEGLQNITTYTVGFDLQGNESATSFLQGLSSAGGGKHFDASSSDELVHTFQEILGDVITDDTAFVSPGATVNQFNRLTHRDDIYFAVFKPSERIRWAGNIKRYRVSDEGDDIVVKDVEDKPAVNPETGFFGADARSFWSDAVDGPDVRLGGFADELALTVSGIPRRVFTYTGPVPIAGPVDLTAPAHALSEDNDLIDKAMLGIADRDDSYRASLLRWARGIDVQDVDGDGSMTDIRHEMGDPMHSQPVILNYGDSPEENETTVFVGTNQGFLHALDPQVGGLEAADEDIGAAEVFSWIPPQLLGNLDAYYENAVSPQHRYGLDGSMSVWIDDRDNDLTVDSDETAYLFFGMRRGGHDFYALDVSDRASPRLAWMIRGGPGGTKGFEGLGQSWSRPIPARIQVDGVQKDVVIFTGGYDTNQDPREGAGGALALRTGDSLGRGLYIVELDSGELVWSGLGTAGGSQRFDDMTYSMPASPSVLDVDQDGLSDQIWASDTGGQVWRFDITPYHRSGSQDGELVAGGVMARLGSSSPAEQRRFYYTPDVAVIEAEGRRFASISIGSGWRAHPLDRSVQDRFYVLRTPDVYERPAGYGRHDEIASRWVPITDLDLADADDLSLDVDLDGHGWYKAFDTVGEKVLSASLTINNRVAFTTYRPDLQVESCSPAIGTGALYILDIVSGRPTADLDRDGTVDQDDDSRLLAHPGIPPQVVAIITDGNEGAMTGPEMIGGEDLPYGRKTRRSFWSDLSDSPENADMADLTED